MQYRDSIITCRSVLQPVFGLLYLSQGMMKWKKDDIPRHIAGKEYKENLGVMFLVRYLFSV